MPYRHGQELPFFALLPLFVPTAALAGDWFFSGNLALSTDYIWRGKSQTQNSPAASASLDLGYEFIPQHSFYVGVWSSNVDFDDGDFHSDTSFEVDLYGGVTGIISIGNGLNWDAGWLRYEYINDTSLNYNEAYGGLSYSLTDWLTVGAMYYYGVKIEHRDPGNYIDVNFNVAPLSHYRDHPILKWGSDIDFLIHVGHYDKKNANHTNAHWDWKLGVSQQVWRVNLELAYTDSDINVDSQDDAHLVFTISTGF